MLNNNNINNKHHFLTHLYHGAKSLSQARNLIIFILFGLTMIFMVAFSLYRFNHAGSFSGRITALSSIVIFIVTLIMGSVILLYLFGKPLAAWRIDPMLRRASVANGFKESPVLISVIKQANSKIKKYEFYAPGIPVIFFEDHLSEIESALNIAVDHFEVGRNKRYVVAFAVDFNQALPDIINWNNGLIQSDDFVLALGESIMGPVLVDLNIIPHMLIGGSTGSGKSVLLKCIIYQCALKGATVYVADFKGGVEFWTWGKLINVLTSVDELIDVLNLLLGTIGCRMNKMRNLGVTSFTQLNQILDVAEKRIILASDEVAQLLEKTGLTKEEREKVSAIERKISIIARQGRAFGVHLIFATQRPDATILDGQIRNNFDFRCCGRADDVLSKIVLDNTDASERVPKYEQGLFLTNDDKLFRGYYFTDEDLNK